MLGLAKEPPVATTNDPCPELTSGLQPVRQVRMADCNHMMGHAVGVQPECSNSGHTASFLVASLADLE